jgi:hypothetical protein
MKLAGRRHFYQERAFQAPARLDIGSIKEAVDLANALPGDKLALPDHPFWETLAATSRRLQR